MSELRLTAHEKDVFNWALDRIIPKGTRPGAGEIGLAGDLEEEMRRTPELLGAVARAVAALDARARASGAADFLALGEAEREAVMSEVEASTEAFPPMLMVQTFSAYYRHPRVLETLGLEPRPPHPKGYEMPPNDLSLLDPVRKRGKLYRDC